jgi:riboflavin kinase / FMN adenylyltransferase
LAVPLQFSSIEAVQLPAVPLHLAIGMFDGVHLGHHAVVEAALQSARRSCGLAAVLTFYPHPSALFRPDQPTRLILEPATKARLLLRLGIDAVITHPFTPDFARITAEEFLPWLKQRLPSLAGIYVGQNWRFGAGRRGDVPLLVTAARQLGLSLFSAPPVNFDGEPISSTRIRGLLEAGDMEAAGALLGYEYYAEGPVVSGRRLGRELGFPTLNLAWSPALQPRFGVYVVRVRGEKSRNPLPAVANYGVRPTVEQASEPRLETHVLGPCPFNQGDTITVEWLRFLRPELKFGSLDELRAQIARDTADARRHFSLP